MWFIIRSLRVIILLALFQTFTVNSNAQNVVAEEELDIRNFFKKYELNQYEWVLQNQESYSSLFTTEDSKKTDDYLRFLYSISMSFQYLGEFKESLIHIEEIVRVVENVHGENSVHFGGVLPVLAQSYYRIGEYEKAINLLKRCEKVSSIRDIDKLLVLLQLGDNYEELGQFSLSISCFENSIKINDQLANPDIALRLNLFSKLSYLYSKLNMFSDAINFAEIAVNSAYKFRDSLTNDLYYSLQFNLASRFAEKQLYDKAFLYFKNCEEYYLHNNQLKDYYDVLLAKAFTSCQIGNLNNAKMDLEKIDPLNLDDKNYYNFVLGLLSYGFGDYGKAITHIENISKKEKNGIVDLFSVNNILRTCYIRSKDYKSLDTFILSDLNSTLNAYNSNKYGLTEIETINYKSNLIDKILFNFGYSIYRNSLNPALIDSTYLQWLSINGDLNFEQKKVKEILLHSNENDLIKSFYQLNYLKSQNTVNIDYSEQERELWRQIYQRFNVKYDYGFSNLKKYVEDSNQIYVELIRIPQFDFFNSYWTEKVSYLVLITGNQENGRLATIITNGLELEQQIFSDYKLETSDKSKATDLKNEVYYNSFWKPIADKIGDAKTVYVSLGGVYNNINLNTLYNPETGKYLIEEKDIRIVNSARDFVLMKEREKTQYSSTTSALYGFPDYNGNNTSSVDTTDYLAATRDLNQNWIDSLTRGGMKAPALPATKVEVEQIAGTFQKNGWKVSTYTGAEASETNIKKEESPRVLHIATHGYFFEDIPMDKSEDRFLGMDRQRVVQDPMLRSGLLFTGANKTLQGEEPKGENGLLSAAEASLLDLRETELVVLSACETGKGEIKNSEGVYGLRKAFADAGAQNIIMSLWKVDDKVTQEFMTRFYEIWLNEKTTIREAFNRTQLEIKAKYPQPYYWGAFILVGE